MPSTFSPKFRLELMAQGEKIDQWGDILNGVLGLIEQAIDGYIGIALTDADTTLTASNSVSDQSRNKILRFTGTLTTTRAVIIPATGRIYAVWNATNQSLTFRTSLGAGVTIPAGGRTMIVCDALDTFEWNTFARLTGGSITGMTSVSATDVLRGSVNLADFTVNSITANYTLVDSDRHRLIRRTGATACTITIPTNATTAFPIGTIIKCASLSTASAFTVAGAGGVTLRRPGVGTGSVTCGAASTIELLKVDTDEWHLIGVVI